MNKASSHHELMSERIETDDRLYDRPFSNLVVHNLSPLKPRNKFKKSYLMQDTSSEISNASISNIKALRGSMSAPDIMKPRIKTSIKTHVTPKKQKILHSASKYGLTKQQHLQQQQQHQRNGSNDTRIQHIEQSREAVDRDKFLEMMLHEPTPSVTVLKQDIYNLTTTNNHNSLPKIGEEICSDVARLEIPTDIQKTPLNNDIYVPETPRFEFAQKQKERFDMSVRVMMDFTDEQMRRIQNVLSSNDYKETIDIYAFTKYAMSEKARQNPWKHQSEIRAWCDMFLDADINEDGDMSYAEFTSYLVELANTRYDKFHSERLVYTNYRPYGNVIQNSDVLNFESFRHVPDINIFVSFETNCTRLKLYDEHLKLRKVVRGHLGPVIDLEYIPEHKLVATAESGSVGLIRFWSANSTLNDHDFFTPLTCWKCPTPQHIMKWTGESLCTGDSTGRLLLWNIQRGEATSVMRGHKDEVTSLYSVRESHSIFSASLDNTVRQWDDFIGTEKLIFRGHAKGVRKLCYSKDFDLLGSGGGDDFVLLWSPQQRKAIRKIRFRQQLRRKTGGTLLNCGNIIGLHMAGNELIVADEERVVRIYDIRTYRCLQEFNIPESTKALASSSSSSSYDMSNDCIEKKLPNQSSLLYLDIYKESATEPGYTLAAACGPEITRFKKQYNIHLNSCDDLPVKFAMYNKHTLTILTVSESSFKTYSAVSGRFEAEFPQEQPYVPANSICTDLNLRRFVLAGVKGVAKVYNIKSGAYSHSLDADPYMHPLLGVLCMSVDGEKRFARYQEGMYLTYTKRRLCTHSMDNDIKATTLQIIDHTKTGSDITTVSLNHTLGLVAVGFEHGKVYIHPWDLVGEKEYLIQTDKNCENSPVTAIHFLKDFPLIIVAHVNGIVHFYFLLAQREYIRIYTFSNPTYTIKRSFVQTYIDNERKRNPNSSINTIIHDPLSSYIYTLDDDYIIKAWDMERFIHAAETIAKNKPHYISIGQISTEFINAASMAERMEYVRNVFKFCTDLHYPILSSELSPHKERTNGISIINPSNNKSETCVMSWSDDGTVYIHRVSDGMMMGDLQQGYTRTNPPKPTSEHWKLQVNVERHIQKDDEFLKNAMKRVIDSNIDETLLDDNNHNNGLDEEDVDYDNDDNDNEKKKNTQSKRKRRISLIQIPDKTTTTITESKGSKGSSSLSPSQSNSSSQKKSKSLKDIENMEKLAIEKLKSRIKKITKSSNINMDGIDAPNAINARSLTQELQVASKKLQQSVSEGAYLDKLIEYNKIKMILTAPELQVNDYNDDANDMLATESFWRRQNNNNQNNGVIDYKKIIYNNQNNQNNINNPNNPNKINITDHFRNKWAINDQVMTRELYEALEKQKEYKVNMKKKRVVVFKQKHLNMGGKTSMPLDINSPPEDMRVLVMPSSSSNNNNNNDNDNDNDIKNTPPKPNHMNSLKKAAKQLEAAMHMTEKNTHTQKKYLQQPHKSFHVFDNDDNDDVDYGYLTPSARKKHEQEIKYKKFVEKEKIRLAEERKVKLKRFKILQEGRILPSLLENNHHHQNNPNKHRIVKSASAVQLRNKNNKNNSGKKKKKNMHFHTFEYETKVLSPSAIMHT